MQSYPEIARKTNQRVVKQSTAFLNQPYMLCTTAPLYTGKGPARDVHQQTNRVQKYPALVPLSGSIARHVSTEVEISRASEVATSSVAKFVALSATSRHHFYAVSHKQITPTNRQYLHAKKHRNEQLYVHENLSF